MLQLRSDGFVRGTQRGALCVGACVPCLEGEDVEGGQEHTGGGGAIGSTFSNVLNAFSRWEQPPTGFFCQRGGAGGVLVVQRPQWNCYGKGGGVHLLMGGISEKHHPTQVG